MIFAFFLTISVLFGLGFLLPIILPLVWRSPKSGNLSSNLSLGIALVGSLCSTIASVIWWKALPLVHTFSLDLWGINYPNLELPSLQIEIGLDHISAFFVLLIAGFSALVAIYSFGALKAEHYRKYAPHIASAFNLFVWATLMVTIAHDVFSLLLTLEIMTLAFGYLTLYKHTLYQDEEKKHPVSLDKQKKARIAPMVYMATSHTSTAFLLIALLILAINAKGTGFNDLIGHVSSLSQGIATTVFVLSLIGLGIRAGFTPAHVWVSLVHPSSPTTTHALSLGIAIKVAIYLMYRFFFQFLQPQPTWGVIVLLAAVATALVNVWYAISSHDLKEALAYHSIENIGIICVGIGLAMISWESYPAIATLALVASLYHLLNHAVFKGLLYMATGSIDNLTHQTVELDRLGGLIKRYQFTSAMFLVGSFAIAGFPPLNGFISEWLTLQAFFGEVVSGASTFQTLLVLLSLLVLVASFALTVFCFYKIAGVALLGLPRTPESERSQWESKDVPLTMKSVMALMAILCLALGVLPSFIIPVLASALEPLGVSLGSFGMSDSGNFVFALPGASLSNVALPIWTLLGVAVTLLMIPLLMSLHRSVVRPKSAWVGGRPLAEPSVAQFTSGGASSLLRRSFGFPFLYRIFYDVPDYLPAHLTLSESQRNPQVVVEYFRAVYNQILAWLLGFSEWFGRKIQNKDIRRYLLYIFIVNTIALIMFLWGAQIIKGMTK